MLQLLKYKTLQPVIDIKIAGHPHVGHKAKVDFISGIVLLLDELLSLHSQVKSMSKNAATRPAGTHG